MTSRDFCFWLQGYFELAHSQEKLGRAQMEVVRRHLALVFEHEIDPSAGSAEHQATLNAIHDGTTKNVDPFGPKLRC